MNSDKIRDRLSGIESSDSDKIIKVLELYEEFIALIARNKVGMVTYAAGTAAEIGIYWRSLISQSEGTSDQGTLVPQSEGTSDQGTLVPHSGSEGKSDQSTLVPQNEGTLVPQSGNEVVSESGAETEVKETVPPLG